MTSVVAVFKMQGELRSQPARALGESYTHLGVRKIAVDETEQTITIEYDATRMDRNGVAALLRRLGVPIVEPVAVKEERVG